MNNNSGPDILGVCEVENKPVMDQLVNSLGALGRNYKVVHHNTSDERGIDVAFIYDGDKFTFEGHISHFILKRTATRDLFQVDFKCKCLQHAANPKDLTLIGNHWPARTGGTLKTEPYRMLAAETLSYWHKQIIMKKGKDAAILFVGDFNDEPFSRSIMEYALSTRSKLKVTNAKSAPRLQNLMWPLMGSGIGTFYWDNFPHIFDQFLVPKGIIKADTLFRIKPDSVKIERFPEMVKGKYKTPKKFGRPSKKEYDEDGFSDHFPVSMVMEEV